MARPKNDPDAPKVPTTPQEAMDQGMFTVDDIPEDNESDPTLEKLEDRARVLLNEKRVILEKIGKARNIGHGLLESEIGSREQAEFFRFYLPQKTRKGTVSENGTDSEDVESDDVESEDVVGVTE